MARPLRLEFASALYHITSRGDRREYIFENDNDRQAFLKILGDVCHSHNWICHAYCLMTNHYHLLIETPDGNLSKGMRQLNGIYTQAFNQQHQRVGHFFQGRYKAILVDKNSYLLEVAPYIVLNPVRAGMVRSVREWAWSSYNAMLGCAPKPDWLEVNWVLAAFDQQKAKAIVHYRKFVTEGKGKTSLWQQLRNQIFLGDGEFVQRHLAGLEDKKISEIPHSQRRPMSKPLEHYRNGFSDRDEAIVAAYKSGGYSLQELGSYFGLHYSRISRIVSLAFKAKSKT